MKKLYSILLLALASTSLFADKITTIFFDVESIFQTDSMRASSYVGKINSLSYLRKVGNLPCQEDLFNQLKPIKALSTQITYNNNLEMPLILSDWLLQLQPAPKIKEIIQKFLSTKGLSDIEVKVLTAIISMMLTPQHLADTQKVRPKIETLLQNLQRGGYKLYLVGNWSNINSMRSEFPEIFRYFAGTFVSGDIHLLKPYEQFYQYVATKTGAKASNSLWIETESKFKTKAQQYGYRAIAYNPGDHRSLVNSLNQFGISA